MYIEKDKPQPPLLDKKDPVGVVLEAFIENDRKVQEVTGDYQDTLEDIDAVKAEGQAKLDAFTAASAAKLKAHTDKTGAVHGENKETVGLGNKDNWPMATMEQHITGENVNAYAHPAGLRAMVEERVTVNPNDYIPARVIPYSSGGMIGDIPQYHHDMGIGELVQSEENPLKYLGETPWEFSTSSGALIFPTINNSPKQGRYTQPKQGMRPFLHGPHGGSKIRVYNKTLDMRRTRPSSVRGWSNGELGTFAKSCSSLMDNSGLLYREHDRWMLRSFNKNAVPMDYADITAFYPTEPYGTFEYAEGWIYNFNSLIEHRAVPGAAAGAPSEIYARFNMRAFKFSVYDYLNSSGPGKMMEQTGELTSGNTTYTATLLPAHNKLEFYSKAGDSYGSAFVRLKNLVNLPAGIETQLVNSLSKDLTAKPLISWKNRMAYHYIVRIGFGWHNKTKTKYWHAWLDFEIIDRPGTPALTSTMRLYTHNPDWDKAKQTMDANFDLVGDGMFKEYAPTIKENGLHPLALGGVFESQGGHIKTYTLYGRQYVTYYQHPYGKVQEFQGSPNAPLDLPTQQEFNAQGTLNTTGMYGDHLRHIPINVDRDTGLITYLVHLRDHRHRYRWGLVKVDGYVDYNQNRDYGNYMGPIPKQFEWCGDGLPEPQTFLVYNDDYQAEMDINGLVFHGGNNYVGFSSYVYDPNSLSLPVDVQDPVVLDNNIVAWLTANVGSWGNPDLYLFYFRKTLFWMMRCTNPKDYPADGKDCYYGVIKNCHTVADALGNLTMTTMNPIESSITIDKLNLYTKASLEVDTSSVFGFDGLNGRDLYIQMTNHDNTTKIQSHDVMINMGPFNNFYIEMTLTHNTATGAVTWGPKLNAADPVFPFDPAKGFQIDYDTNILYGTKLPHRMHINYQSPVMLKRGMWSYRKTPNNFGVSTRRNGFMTLTGGVMTNKEAMDIYPVGSILTIAGKNTVVKKPIQLVLADHPGYSELFVRFEGTEPVLYGTSANPKEYELEPHNGAAAAGWIAGAEFFYYDPAGWRNSFLPVVDNRRMSPYGYGGTFPFFFGKAGEGLPYNRYWLELQSTKMTWDTTKGRDVPIQSTLPVTVKVDGISYPTNGLQVFQIPAGHTGLVSLEIYLLQTIKWARGLTTLTQIGGEVRTLDFSLAEQFSVVAPLPRWITSLKRAFIGTTAVSFPGIENWNTNNIESVVECFKDAPNFNQKLNWSLGACNEADGMFRNTGAFNQVFDNFAMEKVKTASYFLKDAKAFNQPITLRLLRCISLRGFLQGTKVFNQSVSGIDLGAPCDLSEFFMGAEAFNTSIDTWDLTQAYSLQDMFNGTVLFNKPLNLTLSQCRNVIQMFRDAKAFNSAVNLNLPVCTAYSRMFYGTLVFNQALPNWSFIGGTALDEMFRDAKAFNQTLDHWMMERVVTIRGMFRDSVFNQPITTWKFHKLRDCAYLFSNPVFNSDVNNIYWPVDPALEIDAGGIFYAAALFNKPLDKWNTVAFRLFNGIFNGALVFNQPVGMWDTSNATSMTNLFKRARAFNQPMGNWNVAKVQSFDHMFEEAQVFNQDISRWNVGEGRNFAYMFYKALSFAGDLSLWDMKNATATNYMFSEAAKFTSNLDAWDVSNVITMEGMFLSASVFVSNLTNWQVGKVTTFRQMFDKAVKFNGTVGNWDLSNAIDVWCMFRSANLFNQPVANWQLGKVLDFGGMFHGALAFNQNVSAWDVSSGTKFNSMFALSSFAGDVSQWNVAKGETFANMFGELPNFNSDVSNWNVGLSTDFSKMFYLCPKFNSDVSRWNVANSISFADMFNGCVLFNSPLNDWNVAKATHFSGMFQKASIFNQPLNKWTPVEARDMFWMFAETDIFNQDIGSWNTPLCTTMYGMFRNAKLFNQNLNTWNVSKATSFSEMFKGASAFNGEITAWNVTSCQTMQEMFRDAVKFNRSLSTWNTNTVTVMTDMFKGAALANPAVNTWQVNNVTTFAGMFFGAAAFNADISAWNVQAGTQFHSMFRGATSFNRPIGNWNMAKALSVADMFRDAVAFNQVLTNWNVSSVTNMSGLFMGCRFLISPLIENWDVRKVTTIADMFNGCTKLATPLTLWNTAALTISARAFKDCPVWSSNIGNWNMSKVTDMREMFMNATSFNANISLWQTGEAVNMDGMFDGATVFDQPIGAWNVGKCTSMRNTFRKAGKFNQVLNAWNTAEVTAMDSMFEDAVLFNRDLSAWPVGKVLTHVDFDKGATAWTLPKPVFVS